MEPLRCGGSDLSVSEPFNPNPTAFPASVVAAPAGVGLFRFARQQFARQHSVFSATLLLSGSSLLSGLLGLVRAKYVAHVFGARHVTDAYIAAFQLPDMISYFLIGGVASITLVSILNRFRESGDEDGADRALSAIVVAMAAVLGVAIVLGEWLAPWYTHLFLHRLPADVAPLCTHLTRIILPAQLFFFVGPALGARLLVRKIFLYQAITPLIYNLGIIFGGVLLSSRVGIDSLAYGVLGGSLLGPLLLNAFGAMRSGLRFTPVFNLRHPAFLEWVRLSLPLMVGVSLAMADKWILAFYAASNSGAITELNNAKALFNAPLTVMGAAAGSASLPFFSSLFAQGRLYDFNGAVCRAVSRLLAVALLATGWMTALALPIASFLRGGSYGPEATLHTSRYLALFALSLGLWSIQGIYARAFYAARNTMVPAVSGTIVTLASIPVYGLLFHHIGIAGLAIASDLGILAHTVALAVLLHRFRLVSLATLEYPELARALVAALLGYLAADLAAIHTPRPAGHWGWLVVLVVASAVWCAVCAGMLQISGSKLLLQLRNRKSKPVRG